MSETLTKVVVDAATGEHKFIPLSAEEIAARELWAQELEQQRLEREALEAKRLADRQAAVETLKSLGLTEDQIEALIG